MAMQSRGEQLRSLIERKEILVLPGCTNALQAVMIQAAGFEAAYMSGSGTASTLLGMPDAGLTSVTEVVMNARYIASAIGIPLLSDADTGYGNAINVRRTVHEFIRAGVGGIHVEDQVSPKRCGFVAGKQLVSIEEAAGKYRAAVDARDELDPGFVIIARTDARTAVGGGLDEAIARGKAYRQAGADVAYLEAPQSAGDIKAFVAEVKGPVMCTLTAIDPPLDWQALQDFGVAVAFYPGAASMAGNVATWDYLHDFKQRGVQAEREFRARIRGHRLAGFGLFDLVGFPKVREMEERYLPAEDREKYGRSTGMYVPGSGRAGAGGS